MTFRTPSLSTYFISLIIAAIVSGLAWLAIGDKGLALLISGLIIGHFFGSFFSDDKKKDATETPVKPQTKRTPAAVATPTATTSQPGNTENTNNGEIKSIYVGNVAFNAPRGALQSLFEEYGKVISVRLMTDRVTRRPRGYGFVEMESAAALAAIEALDGSEFFNRTLRVNEAKQRAPYRED